VTARVAAAAACVALLGATAAWSDSIEDASCVTLILVQRSDQVVYPLTRRLLRADGDTIWSRTRGFERDADYGLDRTRGVLRLRVPPVPGETLWVHVCGLVDPPTFAAQYAAFRPAKAAPDSGAADSLAPLVTRPGIPQSTTEAPPGTSLAIQGNKTLAVDFGSNQDAFLRQSLDLTVTGTLAPGVELTGVLSDRNTPLTETGSTRDLQSLDRLLIELRAPQGGAALGDVSLGLERGEFARIDRRLQGVRGEWSSGGLTGVAAAASAEGEFQRMQFYGIEGRQGPYTLTGPSGETGIAVVPGSESVTLDGARLTRGEGADYSMDYERAQITFTNRRPIGASSRITVDYQIAVNRFRRNLAAAALEFGRGRWRFAGTALTEGDDRGRPIASQLDASDRLVLSTAGDSSALALGSGVTPGAGDYDLVADSTGAHYAYAGPDSGAYALSFTRVAAGQGDYVDSTQVSGRTAYRWVGTGAGSFRIGRRLPLPDSHQLYDLGGGASFGPLRMDFEGALSRLDRNTFSTLDDADDWARAGSAKLALEGHAPRWLGGTLGLGASTRTVERSFEPFTRLERPFEQEDWGLAPSGDLERQTRHEGTAFLRPGFGGELRGTVGWLQTVAGFQSFRRSATWERVSRWVTRASWERADGEDARLRFSDGGRERAGADLGVKLAWIEPAVRADWDERWTPSDTARSGARSREIGAELRSGARLPWRLVGGFGIRRDAQLAASGYQDLYETRTTHVGLQTPDGARWGSTIEWQRRLQSPLAQAGRIVSDLASARVTGADPGRGLTGSIGWEITSEGESDRARQLDFVGAGLGAYDSLGKFDGTGHGGYTLNVVTGPGLTRVSRAAASLRMAWAPTLEGAWQGSRTELVVETDARRRGALRGADAWLSPGAALEDGELSRGAVTQRLETELAPGAQWGAVRLRLERRASADRSFTNFAQTQDERVGTARVRARPASGWTIEVEGRARRQTASQLAGLSSLDRTLRETGALGQLGYSPGARWRVALVSDLAWTRDAATELPWSRTLRVGPDVGVTVWTRGRLETSARRTLSSGPVIGPLLPNADPLGLVRWETNTRFDYRVGDQSTLGLSFVTRDREGHAPEHEGRAEARAFF
jgi:hypothetical protein